MEALFSEEIRGTRGASGLNTAGEHVLRHVSYYTFFSALYWI